MKRILLSLLVLLPYLLVSMEGQFSLMLSDDDQDGIGSRFSSYLTTEYSGWSFINTTSFKYSSFQNSIADYYQENRAMNLLRASKIKQNWSLDLLMGISSLYSDNHATELAGHESRFQQNSSLTLGGSYLYDNKKYYFYIKSKYVSYSFDQLEQREDGSASITESDVFINLRAGGWLYEDILLTFNYDIFDDLNKIDHYNYYDFYMLAEYSKRLNYIHYLQQDIKLGHNTLDSEISNYIGTHTRLISKFAQNWTLLNILHMQGWINLISYDQSSDLYITNTYYETNFRRNFSVSENNQLSYAQLGALYEFDTEITAVTFAGKYYLSNYKLYGKSCISLGSERLFDHKASIGTGWEFIQWNFDVAYQYQIKQISDEEDSSSHQIFLRYYF